jgi:membrane fusion protein (multidrug efflux system)
MASHSDQDDEADHDPLAKNGDEAGGKSSRRDASSDTSDDADKDDDGKTKKKKKLRDRPLLLFGAAAALILALVVGLVWWLNARNYENTDDAFIDAHIVRLAPQIAGRVTAVYVNDNQMVRPGDPVITIDSADVMTKVAQAQAQKAQAQSQVDNALAQISASQAGVAQARADLAAAQATADNAAIDLARYQRLAATDPKAVAQQQFDQAQTQARQTAAQRDAAAQTERTRVAQLAASKTQVASGQDQVRAAQAQVDEAGVNLGYTQLAAPIAGHITQKSVAVGAYVQPGSQILAIVPLDLWVTANFKETQLGHMRPGERVTVKVDACPASRIRGHVDSIQRGAGQAFGVLPPENATGNFVKVVQRVPVKIVLDNPPSDCPLGPGLSVRPSVRVR